MLAKISFYQQTDASQHNIETHNKNRCRYNAAKNNRCKNLTHTIACNEKINLNIIKFNAIKNYLLKRYFDQFKKVNNVFDRRKNSVFIIQEASSFKTFCFFFSIDLAINVF